MTDDAHVREAYEGAACGLLVLDTKGRVLLTNRLFSIWTGVSVEGMVGRTFTEFFTIGSKLFLQTQWWPLLEMQGSVAEVQLEVLRDDGPAPVLVNAVRRPDRRIDVAVFLAADRRKYERELLAARRRAEELLETVALREAELREAERAAQQRAVFAEQLMGMVSHDLRNPLNAILMGSELLSTADAARRDATIKRIANAAKRATRLTRDLLDFTQARVGGGLPLLRKEVDLHAVVAEAVEELRLAWPGRKLEHQLDGMGPANVDPDRVAQVVTNLVANAMNYGSKETPIVLTSFIREDAVGIRVHNYGRPIPPELHGTIFEPLQRGEEQIQRGSNSIGLGLYIVKEIARAHGGTARVESTAAEGTTFEVVLRPPAG